MSLRNTRRAIPVPGVMEVSSYVDRTYVSFYRPESYITWTGGLGSASASYVMDSEDEVWLEKFNTENGFNDPISADALEYIISSFEKVEDNHVDVKAAAHACQSLERREVVEAVHSYWIQKRKRKHKRLAQVKVFQKQRRAQGLTKAVIGKQRLFKRQASKNGRAKRRTFLDGMSAELDVVDKQKNIVKEAGAAANRLDDFADTKRKKAQLLMEVANKSTYKATMALRICQAIERGNSLAD